MSSDEINGLFELVAGLMILNHCRVLMEDKIVKGVSVLSTFFFTSWGFWNLYYYPSLNQTWSFMGGVIIFFSNFVWVTLMVYYKKNPGGKQRQYL